MAQTLDTLADEPNGAFAFSADAKREIQSILGDFDHSVLSELQRVSANHLLYLATDDRSSAPVSEVRRMLSALGAVIRGIDQASAVFRHCLSAQTVADIGTPTDWENLFRIRHLAAHTIRRLERELTFMRKRGRPKNVAREWLAQEVAVVLKRNGVRITTGRSGKFARVLSTMLFEIVGAAPEDLFPLIKHGSHYVNHMTPHVRRRASSYDLVE